MPREYDRHGILRGSMPDLATTWELLIAFVLAATPWVELLVVIPLGLAWGLPPVALAVVVFVGNTLTIVPVVWLHRYWRAWRVQRAKKRRAEGKRSPNVDRPRTRRGTRAKRLWAKYGLPGLALLAPLVTGVHLAVAIALLAGATRRAVMTWFMVSIAAWTIGLTVTVALGIEGVRWLWDIETSVVNEQQSE